MSFRLRNITVLSIMIFILQISNFSQTTQSNKLPEGLISNPLNTSYGLVFTDEYHSTVYLSNGNQIEELFSSPGCGRYLTISMNGENIGFKSIDKSTGLQAPAVYNLKTRKLTLLADQTTNAGQVSFANDGTIVYSYENKVVVLKDGQKKEFEIGTYSNRTPVSPDGNFVIYKDQSDQLWKLNLNSGAKQIVTDSKEGYANVMWSPDSKSIVYTTNGLKIYSKNFQENNTYYIGEGENPQWLSNSTEIVYFKKEIDYQKAQLLNSDIYLAGAKGEFVNKVTNTGNVFEMDPSFDASTNKIYYQTYDQREVKSVDLSAAGQVGAEKQVMKISTPLKVKFYSTSSIKLNKAGSTNVPDYVHIHQVFDTREDWDQGYSCCGATSCMEAIASFGILPVLPIYTHNHTSNYGAYISNAYTYNGYTYQGYYYTWTTGIHGYLWNSGSPYSNAVTLLQRHGIASYRDESVPWTNVTTEINAGHPYIVCTTQLTAAHIVLIVGVYGTEHTVYANDPFGDKNAGNYGGILNGKNAIYDWSDANTGHEQICPVVWGITAHYNPTEHPLILSYSPANNEDSVKSTDTVSISFNQLMDKASTEAAFSITPAVDGTIFWSQNNFTLNFIPNKTYDKSTKYTVNLSTDAKNFNNLNLTQALNFSFTTKYRNRLVLEKSYPLDMQAKISTTAQIRLQFDAVIPTKAISGNVSIVDANNVTQTIANGKIFSENGKGLIYFESKTPFEKNQMYTVVLSGKLYDTEGTPLGDTTRISFVTDGETIPNGTVADNFESIANWGIYTPGGITTGVDSTATKFALASDKKINGTYSGKLSYKFNGSNGICQLTNSAKPVIGGEQGSNFGVWIYGDLSMNQLEYRFSVNNNEVVTIADTLDWTGWKLIRIPVSLIGNGVNASLTSIVVKQIPDGITSGTLYFDDAQYNLSTAVNDNAGDMVAKDFVLSQNYPNPFNPTTTINYNVAQSGLINIKVFNMLGQEVQTLVNEIKQKGTYQITFNAANLPSGIYFYQLNSATTSIVKKMMLLK